MSNFLSVAVHTLGCKVNQCDADALIVKLKAIGLQIKKFEEIADIYIVNTCTVTHVSDKKSRQMIRRGKKLNPNAFVAVCGCMEKSKLEKIDEADYVFDSRSPSDFLKVVQNMLDNSNFVKKVELSSESFLRTRGFLKIQDGCNRFCSYCIVPYVRGPLTSRLKSDIVKEAVDMVNAKVQEIVLTGIQVASYGDDTKTESLADLISQISEIKGLKRLRLSSIDPWAINENFLNAVKNSTVICDHFHLSLQSGCNKTLANMNRRYTTAEYKKAVDNLREILPNCAITTDVIVGFPGETDEDFEGSINFVKEINFAQVHVFEYSIREGTKAANFENQVPQNIKNTRGILMRSLANDLRKNFLKSQVGKIMPVLVESNNKGNTTNYSPVNILSTEDLQNRVQMVKITDYTQAGYLIGDRVAAAESFR